MNRATILSGRILVLAALLTGVSFCSFGEADDKPTPKVDFSYSFATPHRITIGRPSASDRTLLDLQSGRLRMAWSYDNLAMPHIAPLSFRSPPTPWSIRISPQVDGKPLAKSRWARLDAVLPGLENVYEDAAGSVRLESPRRHDRRSDTCRGRQHGHQAASVRRAM